MEGITIDEMCEKLKLPFKTVEGRIQRAGIKPITKQALYPLKTMEIIKDVSIGRPKKKNAQTNKQRNKEKGKK